MRSSALKSEHYPFASGRRKSCHPKFGRRKGFSGGFHSRGWRASQARNRHRGEQNFCQGFVGMKTFPQYRQVLSVCASEPASTRPDAVFFIAAHALQRSFQRLMNSDPTPKAYSSIPGAPNGAECEPDGFPKSLCPASRRFSFTVRTSTVGASGLAGS